MKMIHQERQTSISSHHLLQEEVRPGELWVLLPLSGQDPCVVISGSLVWPKLSSRIVVPTKLCLFMQQMIALPIPNIVDGLVAHGDLLRVPVVPMVSCVIWYSRLHQYAMRQHWLPSEITVKSRHKYGMVLRARGEVFSSSIRSIIPQEVGILNHSIDDLISNTKTVLVTSSSSLVMVLLIPIIMFGMVRAGQDRQTLISQPQEYQDILSLRAGQAVMNLP